MNDSMNERLSKWTIEGMINFNERSIELRNQEKNEYMRARINKWINNYRNELIDRSVSQSINHSMNAEWMNAEWIN